jgi:predicted enzyme related to lactoylglutathione lyase
VRVKAGRSSLGDEMELASICIVTEHVERLRAFYEKVLQITPQGGGDFVTFPTAKGALSLFSLEGMERMAPSSMRGTGYGGCVIEFEVEDLDNEYERLKSLNLEWVKPPTTQEWGLRSAWFRDPEGNIVNFYASVDKKP